MQPARADGAHCWRCRADLVEGLVCAACEAVQPVAADADLFGILGLPRDLAVERDALERRYHAVARAIHPDRHQTATDRERELSLAASAAANRAYRTLRDPVARARYWLELHGAPLAADNNRVPPALAATVFEVQERLEALAGAGPDAAALRDEVAGLRDDLTARLQTLTDGLVAAGRESLGSLKSRVSEIAYLATLLRDVDRALSSPRDPVAWGPRGGMP
jgi:molecular chaperone HscB